MSRANKAQKSTYSDPRALTRSSASADGPRDALCQSKSCQLTAPQFYHPRDATLALCLSVCVCHKSVFCRNGWTNRAGFLARELPSTHHTPRSHTKDVHVRCEFVPFAPFLRILPTAAFLFFFRTDYMILQTFTVTSEHICFLLSSFSVFTLLSCWFRAVD